MKSQAIANGHTIGYRIRELRQKKDLTQAELGRIVGCVQATVADWEKKTNRAPNKNILVDVAKALDVSVEYLLGAEKLEKPQIPCYGEIKCKDFTWTDKSIYNLEIPKTEYLPDRFAFQITDSLLEPVISRNDYGIFAKMLPENGDIVAIRFLENNKGMIGMWRQEDNKVMILETNFEKIGVPYFFEILSINKNFFKIKKDTTMEIKIEGKLVAVRKRIKSIKQFPKINYILF